MQRSSGILMPVFSLPSPYGIGTLGKTAYDFIDFLADAGQTWWQTLPVGPTALWDSPYQSPSAFAGNPYFIDPDILIEDGLLTREEVCSVNWGDDPEKVDYDSLLQYRLPLLRKAFVRGWDRDRDQVQAFENENASWLPDYALFMALKEHFDGKTWMEWPDGEIRLRRPDAMNRYRDMLQEDVRFYTYLQYLFFSQWDKLRAHAKEKKVKILGDMALYVAMDSADVWSSPENFRLDEKHDPIEVAGVPPDYFSEEGQHWGNPLYDYEFMKRDGYGWWIRRIGGADKLYDAIRIDHFRGLESFWAIPAGEKSAKSGHWVKGPGMDLLGILMNWFRGIQFIAEDLGMLTPEAEQFRRDSGLPGMKVLEFAFDAAGESSYLPHYHIPNCVCYVGTHDNDTIRGWLDTEPKANVEKAFRYLGLNEKEGAVRGMIRGAMGTVSDLCVIQMQDYLELGSEARINTPGTTGGNWKWRMLPGQLTEKLAEEIREMTKLYGRQNRQ